MNAKEFERFKVAVLVDSMKVIGNGDVIKGRHIILQLASRLRYARFQHPNFPDNRMSTYEVIEEEWKEFSLEMRKENYPRAKDEAMDVMATMTRFLLDEDIVDGAKKRS